MSTQYKIKALEEVDEMSLDSDEERCDLVDDKNGQDRHFFCQKHIIAE